MIMSIFFILIPQIDNSYRILKKIIYKDNRNYRNSRYFLDPLFISTENPENQFPRRRTANTAAAIFSSPSLSSSSLIGKLSSSSFFIYLFCVLKGSFDQFYGVPSSGINLNSSNLKLVLSLSFYTVLFASSLKKL